VEESCGRCGNCLGNCLTGPASPIGQTISVRNRSMMCPASSGRSATTMGLKRPPHRVWVRQPPVEMRHGRLSRWPTPPGVAGSRCRRALSPSKIHASKNPSRNSVRPSDLRSSLNHAYPFTAPAVSPWIKWRCSKLNSTATGTVLRMTPADSGPHCTSYCPTM
jgi:hypothetical protein